MPATSYFLQLDEHRFEPTELTQGAWREDEQHVSVLAGLATHLIEGHEPRPDMQVSRLCFEIYGQIPRRELTFEVRTIRPGRTIELVEAQARSDGRTILVARAWRLQTSDTSSVEGIELPRLPEPDECVPYDGAAEWQGNFLRSLEWRVAPGGRDGRRRVWVRPPYALVEDRQVGALARYVAMVDLANGIATRRRPTTMMYPNVELTIHLLRTPDPDWVGLDTSVSFGAYGIGLTSTTLSDQHGPVGRAEQSLTLRLPDHAPRAK